MTMTKAQHTQRKKKHSTNDLIGSNFLDYVLLVLSFIVYFVKLSGSLVAKFKEMKATLRLLHITLYERSLNLSNSFIIIDTDGFYRNWKSFYNSSGS